MITNYMYTVLKTESLNSDSTALSLLNKIATQVDPVLKNHKWTVHILREFYPNDKRLLGLNEDQGQIISIRLRKSHNQSEFIPLEELIDTMLHEIAHIQCEKHDKKFHDLWNNLRQEWENNYLKGVGSIYSNIDSSGQKLDTEHKNLSVFDAKRKAAEAAERRFNQSDLMGSGYVGGENIKGLNAKEAVAIATLTRLEGTDWCGIKDIIEQPIFSENEHENAQMNGQFNLVHNDNDNRVNEFDNEGGNGDGEWICSMCTMVNINLLDFCSVCDTQRNVDNVETIPMDISKDSEIPNDNNDNEYWTCNVCTYQNCNSNIKCEMCDTAPM